MKASLIISIIGISIALITVPVTLSQLGVLDLSEPNNVHIQLLDVELPDPSPKKMDLNYPVDLRTAIDDKAASFTISYSGEGTGYIEKIELVSSLKEKNACACDICIVISPNIFERIVLIPEQSVYELNNFYKITHEGPIEVKEEYSVNEDLLYFSNGDIEKFIVPLDFRSSCGKYDIYLTVNWRDTEDSSSLYKSKSNVMEFIKQ